MATAQQPNIIGQVIANCLIEKKLGAGGMGAVYLGMHQHLRNKVAIKILPAVPPPPQQFVQRFFREARALAALEHKCVVKVFDVGQQDPYYYIVMQFLEAQSLEQIIRDKGKLSISQALRIIRDVADAMSYAHDKKILHRDLKPDNVLVTKDGEVKIIDFGLAKFDGGGESQALTVTGQIMGTPMYMAPEQAEGKTADERTDIYSLGAMGFFILTGEFPFTGKSGMDILLKKIREKPRDILQIRPEIPQPVASLINKMMAKDPEKRFQTMARVRDILNQALKPKGEAGAQAAIADSVIDEIRGGAGGGSNPAAPGMVNSGLSSAPAAPKTPSSAAGVPRPVAGAAPTTQKPSNPPPPSRPPSGSVMPAARPGAAAAVPPYPGQPAPAPIGNVPDPMGEDMSADDAEIETESPKKSGNNRNRRSGTGHERQAPRRPAQGSNTPIIVILVVLLALAVAFAGYLLVTQGNKDKDGAKDKDKDRESQPIEQPALKDNKHTPGDNKR